MTLAADQPVLFHIRSTPSHLPIVRAAIEKACRLIGFDEAASGAVVLSVDEALTNIIRHAYNNAADQPIEIELSVTGPPGQEVLQISLRDHGTYVEPEEIKSRDLADVRPGGLGVHIMKECMDHVEYRQADGGGTLLVLRKSIPSRQGSKKA